MHMYVCAHGGSLTSDISLNHSLPYFVRQTLSLNVEFTAQLDWLASKLQGSFQLRRVFQMFTAEPGFVM